MGDGANRSEAKAGSRALRVLRLFEGEARVLTVEAIARALETSASSAYRVVQDLSRAGFLDPVAEAGYVLGPAFIRYDYLIRRSDPLIEVALPVMRSLIERTTQSATAVLSRRFRDRVMCVHQEQGADPHPAPAYQRGVAMPLFSGATSKIILAHLDARSLRRLMTEGGYPADAVRRDGIGTELRVIRRAGYAVTRSEVTEGTCGIAAPIRLGHSVIGGVSLVFDEAIMPDAGPECFASEVKAAGSSISEKLAADRSLVSR